MKYFFEGKALDGECEKKEARIKSLRKRVKKLGAEKIIWSSEYRSMADALELPGEEGRDKLR